MKRVAWVNQIAAIWLIAFVAFVLRNAATLPVTVSDGIVGLVLLLCSWRVLAEARVRPVASWLSVTCGLWLVAAPVVLRYPAGSLPALNDLAVGGIVTIASVVETWAVLHGPTPQHR